LPADHFDEIGVLSLTAGIDAPAAELPPVWRSFSSMID
jgi:hypothetical protein